MEAMHAGQDYLKVKRDLAWLQKEAKDKDKINLSKKLQAELPTRPRQLIEMCEMTTVQVLGSGGECGKLEAHALLLACSVYKSFQKVGVVVVPGLLDFREKQKTKFFHKRFLYF